MRLFVLFLMGAALSQPQAVIDGFGDGPEQDPNDQEFFCALEQRLPLDFSQDVLNRFSLRVGAKTVVSWGMQEEPAVPQDGLPGFEDVFQGIQGISVGSFEFNGERVSYVKLSGAHMRQIGDFTLPPGDADKRALIIYADYFSKPTVTRLEADYILFYPAEREAPVQR